ncbi:hypothetical protein [Nonomuraea sp. GTA35]|uniref:hypothetical protein n=1 Tax=Nonomuraea sp. GTA35 TaxID=1676746 RepID=UPI0035BFA690
MSTPTTEIADLAAASGLPDSHLIRNLNGLTWHVFRPLAEASIHTIGDLKARTDADLKLPVSCLAGLEAV